MKQVQHVVRNCYLSGVWCIFMFMVEMCEGFHRSTIFYFLSLAPNPFLIFGHYQVSHNITSHGITVKLVGGGNLYFGC